MTGHPSPADHAAAIGEARQRLIEFIERCPDDSWRAAVVDGDPRPVGVIADHVADAYGYLAAFIGDLAAGRPVTVNSDVVDELNAAHAPRAAGISKQEAIAHLRTAGDALIELVARLEPAQLDAGEGRGRRLARIAERHADDHRTEIEAALAATAG